MPQIATALNIPLNDREGMEALMEELGIAVKKRPKARQHGFWLPYAWMTRAIIENHIAEDGSRMTTKGGRVSVSKVARLVMRRAGIEVNPENENCLRVVYYKLRKTPWPHGMQKLLGVAESVMSEEDVDSGVADVDADVVVEDESEEDYLDDELRAELAAEEAERRAAEEEERRLVSQIALSRGLDPDMDEGFQPDNE
jgi:hypothetical protein